MYFYVVLVNFLVGLSCFELLRFVLGRCSCLDFLDPFCCVSFLLLSNFLMDV
ncbi:hypothetical protein DsansV1_C13g0121141 [Dioscorea sansibarensis]